MQSRATAGADSRRKADRPHTGAIGVAGWCQTCRAEGLRLRWSATLVAPQPMFEQLDGR